MLLFLFVFKRLLLPGLALLQNNLFMVNVSKIIDQEVSSLVLPLCLGRGRRPGTVGLCFLLSRSDWPMSCLDPWRRCRRQDLCLKGRLPHSNYSHESFANASETPEPRRCRSSKGRNSFGHSLRAAPGSCLKAVGAAGGLAKGELLLASRMTMLMSSAAVKGDLESAGEARLWFAVAGDKSTTAPHAS